MGISGYGGLEISGFGSYRDTEVYNLYYTSCVYWGLLSLYHAVNSTAEKYEKIVYN